MFFFSPGVPILCLAYRGVRTGRTKREIALPLFLLLILYKYPPAHNQRLLFLEKPVIVCWWACTYLHMYAIMKIQVYLCLLINRCHKNGLCGLLKYIYTNKLNEKSILLNLVQSCLENGMLGWITSCMEATTR